MNKKIKTICVCVAITIVSLALLCIGWAMDVFFIRLLLSLSLFFSSVIGSIIACSLDDDDVQIK